MSIAQIRRHAEEDEKHLDQHILFLP